CIPGATSPQSTETTESMPLATATAPPATPTITQVISEQEPLFFAVKGPQHVSKLELSFTDADRENRLVGVTVWYPAFKPADKTSNRPSLGAKVDLSGAPYPLILSSTKVANLFAPYLVSYGFTWASVDGIDTYRKMNEEAIDQPLDILFALDQIAAHPPEGLESVIDAEHAGVTGYSFDGYNTYALSGARIDPEYYLAQCPTPDATTEALVSSGLSAFDCAPSLAWDEFSAHAGEAITSNKDGLWQAMTDERIRAVMPMSGEGWWLFGEKGLAPVTVPVLILSGTKDELYKENTLIFEHLGSPDKTLISFIGQSHEMVFFEVLPMTHFMVAFFSYHLKGREDMAWYFSEDYVAQQEGLAWGVYNK
ncbi:MAG: hypothetical protein FD147_2513, partial [Chloroflexi bacterium]